MMRIHRTVTLLATVLALVACEQPPRPVASGTTATAAVDDGGARAAIEAANQVTMDAVSRGEARAIVAHYADDALMLPAGAAAVTGPDAIEAQYRRALDAGLGGLKLDIVSVDVAGDLAVETGTYEANDASGNRLDHGKYVVAWRRIDGVWKAFRDIATSSRPDVSGGPAALPARCAADETPAAAPSTS